MGNLFYNIYKIIERKRVLISIAFLLVISILIWIATSLKFDEDISKLVPSNSENEKLQQVLNTTNFTDKIIVKISLEHDGEFSDLVEYANSYTDSLNTNFSEYIDAIQGKIEDEDALETIDFVYDNLPYFLSPEDYNTLDKKINTDSISAITKANYKLLVSPTGFVAKKMIAKDPLSISFLGLKQLSKFGLNDAFKLKDEFLVSKNEKHILLFLNPIYKTSETSKNEVFAKQLYALQNSINDNYISKVKSNFYGGPLIAVANATQIKKDIQLTVGIALSILLILFIGFYRKITIPLILFLPTAFGGVLAISVLSLIRNEISAISLGIGAVLLGVTLDYSLHILTHIRNKETTKKLYQSITRPILMSSITTALAFLCLLFIDSQALQDLGIFASISVIGASVFALLFIPQVYTASSKKDSIKETFIDKLASYNFNQNKLLIIGLLVLLVMSIITFRSVKFNDNLSKLNYIPTDLANAELEIEELTQADSKSLYIISYGNDMETALEANDAVFNTLTYLKTRWLINDFNSISSVLKSEKEQKKQREIWNEFWTDTKISTLKENLITSGTSLGFKESSFNAFFNLIEKDFEPLNTDDFSEITSLPIKDFMSSKGQLKTIVSIVKVNDNQIETLNATFKGSNNTLVIDRQNINEHLLGNLKTDFNNLILYSLGLIIVLLLLFYRGIRLTLVTIIPILLTWLLTLGLMSVFNLEFNIFNIIISTFIFGLGVDYSIFMTNGLQQEKDGFQTTVKTHKTSVILSVITTILGVGVLIFAKHPALNSLALVSIIGIISAMLIAFTIQPFLYKFFVSNSKIERSNGKN